MAYTIQDIKDYLAQFNGNYNYDQMARDYRTNNLDTAVMDNGMSLMDQLYSMAQKEPGGGQQFQNLNQAIGQYDMAQPGYQENVQAPTNLRDSAGMHSINQLAVNPAAQTTFGNAINNEAGPGWGSTWNNAINYAVGQGKQMATPPAATNTTVTQPTTTTPGQNLGNLYPPRQDWGNFQTSNRGGRYFSPVSGNYQGMQGLYGQQQQ